MLRVPRRGRPLSDPQVVRRRPRRAGRGLSAHTTLGVKPANFVPWELHPTIRGQGVPPTRTSEVVLGRPFVNRFLGCAMPAICLRAVLAIAFVCVSIVLVACGRD